ncbi:hypothetical protein [Streptomyces sp. NPDC051567]|uniref:pPIWI_RE_Y domain-containing protein n=1 Tax=Streptomyces sp. NPDC051567 TaxID=3365660 RepID=UPI0037AC6221
MPLDAAVTTGQPQEGTQSAMEILALLARALVILSRSWLPHAFALPYPREAQSALDRVVLYCMAHSVEPPENLPALVGWCRHRTIGQFPVRPPSRLVPPEARLLVPETGVPTRTCAELASYGRHGLVEQRANRLMAHIEARCPTPSLFRECRSFLLTHPVVPDGRGGDPRVWEQVRRVYSPAGTGQLLCTGCGLPAHRPTGGSGRNAPSVPCEREDCATELPPPRVDTAPDGALLLDPALRTFLCLTAPTERAVLTGLTVHGVTVEPHEPARSLFRLTSPAGQEPRLLGVYDRKHPGLLAARVSELLSHVDGTLIVAVPDHHIRRPGFREAFESCLDVAAVPRVRLTSPAGLGRPAPLSHHSSEGAPCVTSHQ